MKQEYFDFHCEDEFNVQDEYDGIEVYLREIPVVPKSVKVMDELGELIAEDHRHGFLYDYRMNKVGEIDYGQGRLEITSLTLCHAMNKIKVIYHFDREESIRPEGNDQIQSVNAEPLMSSYQSLMEVAKRTLFGDPGE